MTKTAHTPFVCALDSGGSKTLCWILDAKGELLAWQNGLGAANIHDEQILQGIIAPILQAALQNAGLQAEQITAVNVSLGGLNELELARTLTNLLPASKVQVFRESSGEAVFVAAPHWGFDIALMAGTGVVALGINPAGLRRSCGGWGALMHDLGGGHSVGQAALRGLAEAVDFRHPETMLLPALAAELPFKRHLQDCHFLQKPIKQMSYEERLCLKNAFKAALPQLDRRAVAGLFPVVCACAEKKDPFSRQLLEQAAHSLVKICIALASDLHLSAPRIALLGGVFKAGETMLGVFQRLMQNDFPAAQAQLTDFSQIKGSALLALQLAGIKMDAAIVAKIRRR
ncbi:MAG: BadF/BadG/BcrA/BcrD ATPase family protein [Lentisphaeria bacterium]|nr:BadF/BadG/BcrA/BcrD ATPase family protein [Lentisphaeria bacterium]